MVLRITLLEREDVADDYSCQRGCRGWCYRLHGPVGEGGGEAVADYSPRKNLQYKLFFIGPASDFSGCGTGHARIPAMLHAG